MAIAELTGFAEQEAADVGVGRVRVGVHDASRIEWSLSIPLPDPGEKPTGYELTMEMRIPQNAFVRHVPWDQMQAFTRLDGPAVAGVGDAVSIDALRRGALATANQLARAADGFQRHCRLAASLFATAPHSELEDALNIWIEAAVKIAQEARERIVRVEQGEPAEVSRERKLVDEYVSVRLFEMLAGSERALDAMASSKSPHAATLAEIVTRIEERLAEALGDELQYRNARGFTNADPTSPHALERYLDRGSRLKKHFQEVLFLEQESFQVAERAYHWIAGFVALLASTWAFTWQLLLTKRATTAAELSTGIVVLAMIAGVIYATKDRIKEIGRNWMTRRVHRVWGAQRISRYRAPSRRLPARDVVVTARESFHQEKTPMEDALNPDCGATSTLAVLRYEHKGVVMPNAQLVRSGVRRVKHVFRYDLSPLFARLDDALKPVPVLDGVSRRVRFIDAPRCYRLPIRVTMSMGSERHVQEATLIMHKRGLDRLERREDSDPVMSDTGIDPS